MSVRLWPLGMSPLLASGGSPALRPRITKLWVAESVLTTVICRVSPSWQTIDVAGTLSPPDVSLKPLKYTETPSGMVRVPPVM